MKTNNHWFRTAFLAVMVLAVGTASQAWGASYTAIDLTPSGFNYTEARGISGTQQVGFYDTSGSGHALLWNGSAAGCIDLTPPLRQLLLHILCLRDQWHAAGRLWFGLVFH